MILKETGGCMYTLTLPNGDKLTASEVTKKDCWLFVTLPNSIYLSVDRWLSESSNRDCELACDCRANCCKIKYSDISVHEGEGSMAVVGCMENDGNWDETHICVGVVS